MDPSRLTKKLASFFRKGRGTVTPGPFRASSPQLVVQRNSFESFSEFWEPSPGHPFWELVRPASSAPSATRPRGKRPSRIDQVQPPFADRSPVGSQVPDLPLTSTDPLRPNIPRPLSQRPGQGPRGALPPVREADFHVDIPSSLTGADWSEERDCVICVESKGVASFPVLSASRDCNHAPGACLACLQQHIKIAIDEKAWHGRVVTCPECNSAMAYDEVRLYADRATFETYDARVLNDAVAQHGDWFRCPGAGCGSGQMHDAADGAPIVTCVGCRRKYCFRHHMPWHETMSCDEFDRFLADPENFRSAFEVENERVDREREAEERRRREMEAADSRFALSLVEEEKALIEAEAMARREEAARAEAERVETEHRAAQERAAAAARAQMAEEAKRRAKENAASEAVVKQTTKNCPGCGWPIEKNDGWHVPPPPAPPLPSKQWLTWHLQRTYDL